MNDCTREGASGGTGSKLTGRERVGTRLCSFMRKNAGEMRPVHLHKSSAAPFHTDRTVRHPSGLGHQLSLC